VKAERVIVARIISDSRSKARTETRGSGVVGVGAWADPCVRLLSTLQGDAKTVIGRDPLLGSSHPPRFRLRLCPTERMPALMLGIPDAPKAKWRHS
jgi:hypothetical protein